MPASSHVTIPEILPAFVLKDLVAFPYMVLRLRQSSKTATAQCPSQFQL